MSDKTKPKKIEEPQLTSKELEVLLLILTELRKLNERAEKTGVVTKDYFR